MGLNRAQMLHEATQKALGGSWTIVQVPNFDIGSQCALTVFDAVALESLLHGKPREVNRDGRGWDVIFVGGGLLHFTANRPDTRDFRYAFRLLSLSEIRAEVLAVHPNATLFPILWSSVIPLVCEPVYVPSRYERVLASIGG